MKWTESDLAFLRTEYPKIGKSACAEKLCRSKTQIRSKASELGLKLDRTSRFWIKFQARAAKSKTGRKNPKLAGTLQRLFSEGKRAKPNWSERSRRKLSERTKKMIADSGHPRGMLGKKHTPETREIISKTSKERADAMTPEQWCERDMKSQKTRVANGTKFNAHGSWKAGWREIGGQRVYFRSRWEANYARFLEWQRLRGDIAKWEHEPQTFWFEGVKRGCVSYLPDFRVTFLDGNAERIEYHEVKGWMDARSITKIKRMRKYHPDVKLVVVDAKSYRKLASLVCTTIHGWE